MDSSIVTKEKNSLGFLVPPIRKLSNHGTLMIIINITLTLSLGNNSFANLSTIGGSASERATGHVGPPETGELISGPSDQMKLNDYASDRLHCGEFQGGERQVAGNYRLRRATKSKKNIKNFTYRLMNYPRLLLGPIMPSSSANIEVDKIFAKAFASWSVEGVLNFTNAQDGDQSADVRIEFVTGEHDCRMGKVKFVHILPLGEPHGNLKYGAIHFDDKLYWALGSTRAQSQNLLAVAIHYIGHVLGLPHSQNEASVMYRSHIGNKKLLDADKIALQALHSSSGDNRNDKDDKNGKKDRNGENDEDDREQYSYAVIMGRTFSPAGDGGREAGSYIVEEKFFSFGDCKSYMADNNHRVGLWNETSKMCGIKKTNEPQHELKFSDGGEALGHYGINGDIENTDVSTLREDAQKWINETFCDIISKIVPPRLNEITYQCRQYNENPCCNMIFLRDEKAKNIPNLMKESER